MEMFKSYTYNGYLGYNKETGLYSYEYEIVDTEFTETAVGEEGRAVIVAGTAVINTYSKRNLNVPLNLLLCMRYIEKQYPYSTIEKQIAYNRKYVPNFSQYKQDINKYLSLI